MFSDETLDTFEIHDQESYRAIVGHFAYWDDIEIHFRGTTHRIGGNGFCGCSRATLLKILGRRARSLGVEIEYQREISPLDPAIRNADLVVVADGINSRWREIFAERFKPHVELRPNFFSWMGSTRPFDAFTFFFGRPSTASSSTIATNTNRSARPGLSRPIQKPSHAPASTSSMKLPPRVSPKTCSRRSCKGIG